MLRFSRKTKIVLAILLVLLFGYFLDRWLTAGGGIPAEFNQARLQGAVISQNIVQLSSRSADDLQQINKLDQEKKFSDALDLTIKVVNQSREIREQAVSLSGELTKMTQALSGIDSFEARQAALEAISSDLALLSRLINYSDYLNDLLNTLSTKFSGATGDHKVSSIIDQINAEVTAINNFNKQATQAMQKFDSIVNTH